MTDDDEPVEGLLGVVAPRFKRLASRFRLVEVEEQLVRGDHNLGVLPFGGAVVAGDQAHAV